MMPNGKDDNKNQAVTAARVTMMVARATVTGAKRAMATMATTVTMATTAMTVAMAKMATMTPNSDDAASGDEGNEDTKRWWQQQRQRRTMGVVNPAEAQDAAIAPTAVPQWCLCHHTVVSQRIDTTGEYIKSLDQNKIKSGTRFRPRSKLDWLAGQPIQIWNKMKKKRPCKYLDSLNLELWNEAFNVWIHLFFAVQNKWIHLFLQCKINEFVYL
jgi:hypothetical protein